MSSPELGRLTLGVIGGTGALGRGLAYRWALAGLTVLIGSREAGRAEQVAQSLRERVGWLRVRGTDNLSCAAESSLVVVAVPFDAHAALLGSLRAALTGTIVVDCVNPVAFDRQGPFVRAVPEGSAAQQAQTLLPDCPVVAAFHHVPAALLDDPGVRSLDLDVLVLGDDRKATELVCSLAATVPGVRGIYAGRLRNAGQVEALAANLIAINRRYHTHAGIRITGV